MPDRSKPSPIPSLIPFIVLAAVLILIYVGFLLFPAVKTMINRQDCIASGRSDCGPHL